MENSYLLVKDLHVDYIQQGERVKAIAGASLSLEQGQMGVLIGPSGCGKSTLMSVLAGIKARYRGQALISGQKPVAGGDTALILQNFGLLPWKTVWENIILGLELRNISKEEGRRRGEAILEKMNLTAWAKRYPAQLSGGQRQRVAIMRALIVEPQLLLMDEPFSSLDALTREEIQDYLLDIWAESKLTTLLITHSIEEAVFLGQRIFVMSEGPGQVINKIENSLAGKHDARGKVEFTETCSLLRAYLHSTRGAINGASA